MYKCPNSMPKFRAADLKKRAVDIEGWYQNFIVNGLPQFTSTPLTKGGQGTKSKAIGGTVADSSGANDGAQTFFAEVGG